MFGSHSGGYESFNSIVKSTDILDELVTLIFRTEE
jgi:hypothetical protein